MGKKVIAVIFGGQSSEHVVSCMSVANVINNIDQEQYTPILIGITEKGHWLKVDSIEEIQTGSWVSNTVEAVISPDATQKNILFIDGGKLTRERVDAAFPVLHGLYGEDGTIQGLLELAGIPYVGCGVLASAVAMDKLYTKIIADKLGIRQADYIPVLREDLNDMDSTVKRVEERLVYPVFIKPSNAGSSRGVSKAENTDQLISGMTEAARHDRKILVEETIVGHEIECAVFGGGADPVKASGVGEILAAADFYDFDAKYYNEESKTVANPQLPGDAAKKVRETAIAIFKAIDGYGLSRVDFFVTDAGEVVFNEINTIPGFTAISMYPMLWEAEGMSKKELVSALIEHACKRYL